VPNLDGRPTAQEILSNKFSSIAQELDSEDSMSIFPSLRLRCKDLQTLPDLADDDADEDQPLDVLAIQETYYLWKLAGGDILGELTKHGLMVTRPPIVSVPRLVLGEGHLEGQRKERCSLFDPIVIKLSHTQLGSCLKELSSEDCYPLLLENGHDKRDSGK
jgi:TBC domain-containing protein kinase-like protein